ncbi:hypothetical protein [Streptomyces sp. NPDC048142]
MTQPEGARHARAWYTGDSDELDPGPLATYDLIICHQDRIMFHDHYE